MKLTAFPKTIFCLALLLAWGNCAPPATAQNYHGGPSREHWILIESQSAPQTVEVQTPRGNCPAVFQSEARVFPNGSARGFLTLIPTDCANSHIGALNVAMGDGSVRFNRDGTVAGVMLRGHSEEGNPVVVMITPAASEDRLICTVVSFEVRATWEAQGSLTLIR